MMAFVLNPDTPVDKRLRKTVAACLSGADGDRGCQGAVAAAPEEGLPGLDEHVREIGPSSEGRAWFRVIDPGLGDPTAGSMRTPRS